MSKRKIALGADEDYLTNESSGDESSEYDDSDTDYNNYTDSDTKLNQSEKNTLIELQKIKRENEITLNKILNSNFTNKDKIWFMEYLKILDNIEPDTEDYFRIKQLINEKYNNLNNLAENNSVLEKIKNKLDNNNNLINKILISEHSDDIKAILFKKYQKYMNSNENTEEYHKDIKWIENVLDLPTRSTNININNQTNLNNQIISIKKYLDDNIYGLEHVKEKVIEAYCAINSNNNYQKQFIALAGPPGVGKTVIAKTIAQALNLPFGHIDFCSIKDPNMLIGHSQTYIGSTPGILVNILKETKCLNPVILLDEIDKIPDELSSIHYTLLHILDKSRNYNFVDSYMPEVKIDLSKVFFIIALNDEKKINNILKDRLSIIKIDSYSKKEKITIGINYILPNLLNKLNFNKKDITIDELTMDYIITMYLKTDEHGVRELEKLLTSICEKINVLKNISKGNNKKRIKMSYHIPNLKFPLSLDKTIVDLLLSK